MPLEEKHTRTDRDTSLAHDCLILLYTMGSMAHPAQKSLASCYEVLTKGPYTSFLTIFIADEEAENLSTEITYEWEVMSQRLQQMPSTLDIYSTSLLQWEGSNGPLTKAQILKMPEYSIKSSVICASRSRSRRHRFSILFFLSSKLYISDETILV